MSEPESSNNKLPLPTSPKSAKEYSRHPQYYYEDGGTVFLASRVLFKLPASLLKADSGAAGYKFEGIMTDRFNSPRVSPDKPGASDENPIVLPLKASLFSRLLLVVLGRIGDPDYQDFLTAAHDPECHNPSILVHYIDAGVVASYFGMKHLESWVYSQIRLVLKSEEALVSQEWPGGALIRLIAHLQTDDLPDCQHELLTLAQLLLCPPTIRPCRTSAGDQGNLQVYASLYKLKHLVTLNPALFGVVFAIVLSLGHRSSIWTEHLTRDDRTVLLAAHADLTKLHEHKDLELAWLTEPSRVEDVCSQTGCSQAFSKAWDNSFARCKRLDSPVALEDIKYILTLPRHRLEFFKQCRGWDCRSRCAQKSLDKIDDAIRGLFCGLTKKYELWVRTA